MTLRSTVVSTPIGSLALVAEGEAIVAIHLPHAAAGAGGPPAPVLCDPLLERAARQLEQYFGGTRASFDLPLALHGTPFQLEVLRALGEIPFGHTVSYRDVARRIGRPTATRAVGAANARNPLPIVVPCHRVVGANGTLTGYAGGIEAKKWLLAHEAISRRWDRGGTRGRPRRESCAARP